MKSIIIDEDILDEDILDEDILDEDILDDDFIAEDIPGIKQSSFKRQEFSKLATELSDDDLSSSGVQKLLLGEISRLEKKADEHEEYKEKYYEADKKVAILTEKNVFNKNVEILYSSCLAVGAILVGLTPSIKDANFNPMLVAGCGFSLIVVAVLAKVFKS